MQKPCANFNSSPNTDRHPHGGFSQFEYWSVNFSIRLANSGRHYRTSICGGLCAESDLRAVATASLAMRAWPALLNSNLPSKAEAVRLALIGLPVALMLFGVFAVSQVTWGPALSWRNGIACVASILLISLPIWAVLIWQGRQGLPTRLRLTGFVGGLVASGFGVPIFALSCAETSPAYNAVWYGVAVVATGTLGAMAAPRLLRW